MAKKLSNNEIQVAIAALPGWELKDGKLYREFRFADFPCAFAFMTASAIQAEAANHHPEWFNVYNVVRVWLVTHDVNGISDKDVDTAKRMDILWQRALGQTPTPVAMKTRSTPASFAAIALLVVIAVMATAGCTTKAWYEGVRFGAANDCRRQPPGLSDQCLARMNSMSYEEYERSRLGQKQD